MYSDAVFKNTHNYPFKLAIYTFETAMHARNTFDDKRVMSY